MLQPVHRVVPILLVLVFSIAATVAGECPVDGFSIAKTCTVCTYPSVLTQVGDPADACYTCVPAASDQRSCDEYWQEATPPSSFTRPRIALSYRIQGLLWSRAVAKGDDDTALGTVMLNRAKGDSRRSRFRTQTAALGFLTAVAHFGNQFQPARPWPNIETRVRFEQLTILGTGGTVVVPSSNVASVTLDPGLREPRILEENGGVWTNMVVVPRLTAAKRGPAPPPSEEDWRVRNLYLNFGTAAEVAERDASVLFGLGTPDGIIVDLVEVAVLQDAEALPFGAVEGEVAGEGLDDAFVVPDDLKVGGLEFGEGVELDAGDYADFGDFDGCPSVELDPGACELVDPPARTGAWLKGSIPVVNEHDNHCAPAAVARGLAILFPDFLPNILQDELAIEMGTDADGTSPDNIKSGKDAFVAGLGLDVTTTETEQPDWSDPADVRAKFAAAVDAAIATLANGGVVEMSMTWLGPGSSRSKDGHMALVTDIYKRADGSVKIVYVDDPKQNDNVPENKSHVIYIDQQGKFSRKGEGNFGQVDGFLLERRNS